MRKLCLLILRVILRQPLCCLLILICFGPLVSRAETVSETPSSREQFRFGERIYREGILPSGQPMQAFVRGDLSVPGTSFSCISCHLRSGLGSIEGGVYTPPTNGATLFKPLQTFYKNTPQNPKYFPVPPRRPAYTVESLIKAINEGIDPNGRVLNDVMPRYLLDGNDMSLLVSYLKNLSSEFSPGVTDSNIHFATVISEDVSPRDRETMLAPLQKYISIKNNNVAAFKMPSRARSHLMADNMMAGSKELVHQTLSLSVWELKGPPETWRSQLEEYNRTKPPFALLGGITSGEWQPVHTFCEENKIPCIFPNTDFPVISPTDWYTLYLAKGFYQEGEAAARYLNSKKIPATDMALLQVVRDSREARALASGFQNTWHELGHQPPTTVMLKPGESLDARKHLNTGSQKPAVILLWDGTSTLAGLESLAAAGNAPEMFVISGGYLGKEIWKLPEPIRNRTYLTYPYRISKPQPSTFRPSSMGMGPKNFSSDSTKAENQTYAIIELLTMALMDMKGNYYRDNFLDAIGMIMDQEVPLYERLSFGPGQRYASKGCYIIQLGAGQKPELIKRSDWVIH